MRAERRIAKVSPAAISMKQPPACVFRLPITDLLPLGRWADRCAAFLRRGFVSFCAENHTGHGAQHGIDVHAVGVDHQVVIVRIRDLGIE